MTGEKCSQKFPDPCMTHPAPGLKKCRARIVFSSATPPGGKGPISEGPRVTTVSPSDESKMSMDPLTRATATSALHPPPLRAPMRLGPTAIVVTLRPLSVAPLSQPVIAPCNDKYNYMAASPQEQ